MKKILRTALLFTVGLGIFTACDNDLDDNPTIKAPTEFVLNIPTIAENTIDLANSTSIELTCSQPDYGFPANTRYYVQVALSEDMANYVEIDDASHGAKIDVDAATLASTLTNMQLEAGKTEADFPMTIPVYVRVRANIETYAGVPVENTSITSNVVTLNSVRLLYSLPPVTTPDNLYITGAFNNWDWGTALGMVQVNSATNIFWHLVYIGGENGGIKFNSAKEWDGNEQGFDGINISGDLAGEIISDGGNIASSNPGWYLMIVTTSVSGRDIVYDVQFNKPEVWLIGGVTPTGAWDELMDGCQFEVPTTADGNFVSPAFANTVPGTEDGGSVRAYVKIPGYDWWKSEFMVFEKKIVYRANGGDQDRVAGTAGQKLYLNFTNETGEIK